jgi:beta-1,2-mannobiose phosphorylase / 1,2-beta-oligomannan phosphorylase
MLSETPQSIRTAEAGSDLARRFEANPLLKPADMQPIQSGWRIECLLNPGVFRFKDRIWLLVRVAERPPTQQGFVAIPELTDAGEATFKEVQLDDPKLRFTDPRVLRYDGSDYLTTISHFRLLSSEDGIHFSEDPAYPPLLGAGAYETFGIEDPRITQLGNEYYLTYTAVSSNGVAVAMRSTTDWKTFKNHGLILPPHNKDCALFNEKVGGLYLALHRPSSPDLGGNYIWLARSPNLLHWGNHACLIRTRPGMWDSIRIGAGASPIRTPRGWLAIYHGANEQSRYCLGAMLLDLQDPSRVLARSSTPIMEPLEDYETAGFFGNVVFTNGHLINGDELIIYYGASDSVVCGARFSLSSILQQLNDV